ncbi:MAG: purine-nucleoside phosphorylase [Kofleriaceae bacterium]|nr:purine-nucleoside phosphorylase [Kofleriaceae bacterium]
MNTYDNLQEAAAGIQSKIGQRKPKIGLILGSGLGAYADTLEDAAIVEYSDIPHFPVSTVSGHAGRLVVGSKNGIECAALQGRVHFYEGHDARTLVFPARTLITLGVEILIITNAAGGIHHDPGTLMVISDHINLFPDHPLRGVNDERIGVRFPDMTTAYDPELQKIAHAVGKRIDFPLAEGVYAGLPGPSYETPAEIRMLRTMGASAAGMSTVPEVIAANHMGAKVLGISCITNKAAGLSGQPLSHEEVTETATAVHSTFIKLLDEIIKDMAKL